jgi:hypothetical protein
VNRSPRSAILQRGRIVLAALARVLERRHTSRGPRRQTTLSCGMGNGEERSGSVAERDFGIGGDARSGVSVGGRGRDRSCRDEIQAAPVTDHPVVRRRRDAARRVTASIRCQHGWQTTFRWCHASISSACQRLDDLVAQNVQQLDMFERGDWQRQSEEELAAVLCYRLSVPSRYRSG